MNFKKHFDDIGSIGGSKGKKLKADGFDETELRQLENDSSSMLNNITPSGMTVNRDLGQLKELLSKNIHDGGYKKRIVREGNGRKLLAEEKFNHGLIENQLMSLKQDLNVGAKVISRKIYRVKRANKLTGSEGNEFNNLVDKLKKRGTQYELDFTGREDKRLGDHNMYLEISADIQDEFRRFEGKHQMDFNAFISEDVKKNIPMMQGSLPKTMKSVSKTTPFSSDFNMMNISKHDSNTKAVLDGYYKGVQSFLEDSHFAKKYDVLLTNEFYDFEKSYHNTDDSFENIFCILRQMFEGIDYDVVQTSADNPETLDRRICQNTCTWFENEF
jgi:hypothetical protein